MPSGEPEHAGQRAGQPQGRDHARAGRHQPALRHPRRAPWRDHHRARRPAAGPRRAGPPARPARGHAAGARPALRGGDPRRRREPGRPPRRPAFAAAHVDEARRVRPEPAQLAADLRQLPVHRRRTGGRGGRLHEPLPERRPRPQGPAGQPRAVQPALPGAGHAAVQHAAANRAGAQPADRGRASPPRRRRSRCSARCRCRWRGLPRRSRRPPTCPQRPDHRAPRPSSTRSSEGCR